MENHTFSRTLEDICRQKFDMKKVKSLTVGKVVFKGFTVSMDMPADGLFVNVPSNLDDLVCMWTDLRDERLLCNSQ